MFACREKGGIKQIRGQHMSFVLLGWDEQRTLQDRNLSAVGNRPGGGIGPPRRGLEKENSKMGEGLQPEVFFSSPILGGGKGGGKTVY